MPKAQTLSPKGKRHTVLRRNPRCGQAFFVYSGLGPGIAGVPPLMALKQMGILNRNVALFRDLRDDGYRSGVGESLPTMEAFIGWQRNILRQFEHTRGIYCMGTSAGGYAAMISGHHLGADLVWALAPHLRSRDGAKPDHTLDHVLRTLQHWNGKTRYRVYYNESFEPDRRVAERLNDFDAVETFPQGGEGHVVMNHMYAEQKLAALAPPFVEV